MLYNLFSNFGNIMAIVYHIKNGSALLEYENIEYSFIAKTFLDAILFYGRNLRLSYVKQKSIDLKRKLAAGEILFVGSMKTFRFKKNKNISINPPSETLHVSNLAEEISYEEDIEDLFSECGKVVGVE